MIASLCCLYVEVPNTNDALLSLYDVPNFRKFFFFKDHLQYFCRHSLSQAVARAGLRPTTVSGHNRFGLANHLYWLRHGKPEGQKVWSFLDNPALAAEYSRALASADLSDSLVAQIFAPAGR